MFYAAVLTILILGIVAGTYHDRMVAWWKSRREDEFYCSNPNCECHWEDEEDGE